MSNKKSRAGVDYKCMLIASIIATMFLMVSSFAVHSQNVETIEMGGYFATNAHAMATSEEAYMGEGCWKVDGATAAEKFEFYVYWYDGPGGQPDITHNLGTFTIDDIQSISYHTNKPLPTDGANPYNFYLVIYTLPDGVDDYGWYGYSLTAEPYFARNLSAPANTWNEWNTDAGTNHLTFCDHWKSETYGFYGEPTLQEIQAGTINWYQDYGYGADQDIDYGSETVKAISFQTGSDWYDLFNGYIDAITIALKNGTSLTVDLENEVWVDDDFDASTPGWGYDHFATIQDGIDAVGPGGTVHVADGIYNEQLTINKSIDLVGQPGAKIVAPNNAIRNTYKIQESSHTFDPVIFAYGGTYSAGNNTVWGNEIICVNISGFEIDGNNDGVGDVYAGILLRNVEGRIYNNYVHNMHVSSGNPQTFCIEGYGNSNVRVDNNTVMNYTRGGIVFNGDLGSLPDPYTIVENNTVVGNGISDGGGWAENGIQIGWGASGIVQYNDVSANGWPGGNWAGTGIIIPGTANVIVRNNDVHDNEVGISTVGYEDWKNAPCHDITIKDNHVYSNVYGIRAEANVDHVIIEGNTIHDNDYYGVDIWAYVNVWGIETSYPDNITIQDNKIYNHDSCGIYLSDVYDNISISQNDIYNNGEGIYLDNCYGVDSDAAIHYNNIRDNTYYGVWNNGTILVDATCNWWGSNSGPYDPKLLPNTPNYNNPDGEGDNVTAYVDYKPWLEDHKEPNQTIELGEPKIIGPDGYYMIGPSTKIWINSSDDLSGSKNISYEIYWKENLASTYVLVKKVTVDDNDLNDTDPTEGRISVCLTIDENCVHQIDAACYDNEGNVNYTNIDFLVDAVKPVTTSEWIGPQCSYNDPQHPPGTIYINNKTIKRINATDYGCEGGAGVKKIRWAIGYINTQNIIATGEVYDQSNYFYEDENVKVIGDNDNTIGQVSIDVILKHDCQHYILYSAVDYVGNEQNQVKEPVKVDTRPPVIEKVVGQPNCTGEMPDEWYITSDTKIWINATDDTTFPCSVGGVNLTVAIYSFNTGEWTYRYAEVPTGSQDTASIEPISLSEECKYWINVTARDCLNNTAYDNFTVYVDDTPPQIIKTVGDPKIAGDGNPDYWVTTDTVITIDVDEPGCCNSRLENVSYRIYRNEEWTPWVDITSQLPYTLTFSEECSHILQIVAKDCLGNTAWDNETFYVDDTPPTIDATIGQPNCTGEMPDEWCIKSDTKIWVNATDAGTEPCIVGSVYLSVSIYSFDTGEWTYHEDSVDSGIASINFTIPEDCVHWINITAVDDLGNTEHYNFTVYVDDSPPRIIKTVGDPKIAGDGNPDYWVTTDTIITIDAEDLGCCGLGLENVSYRIIYPDETQTSWIDITANLPYELTFSEECNHTLQIVAKDCLGNTVWDNETFYVDDTPPIMKKEIGEPHYSVPSDDCVLAISFLSEDNFKGVHPPTSGWSTGDACKSLGTDHLYLLSGNAELFAFRNGDPGILTHRGTKGLGVSGGEPDEVDSIDREESIVIEFNEPVYLCGFEIRSLLTGEGPNNESEKGDVALYLGDAEVGNYTLVGTDDGVVYQPVPDTKVDKIKFFVNETADYNSYSEYAVARIYLKNTIHYVTEDTPIYLNITDIGTEPCIVGSLHVRVGVWYNGEWSYTWYNQSDSPMNETIYLGGDCIHYLNVTISDDLGNMVYDNETFYVDNTPPVIDATIGQPKCPGEMPDEWYITSDTKIWVNATDTGTEPCIVGSVYLNVSIYSFDTGEWTYHENSVDSGTVSITFTIPEDCVHWINITAVDDLGNTAYHNETVYVDNIPPISTIHYKSVAPGWKQMNEEGFGDMSNDYAWGMAVYEIDGKEYLYVGTINTDYTGDPQVDGCEIWRTDGTIGDDGKYVWEQVVGPNGTQMPAGFGMNVSGVRVMTVYDGLLWVGCMGAPMDGGLTVVGENCTVWVTNGTEWKMANVPGFGENHQSIRGMAIFNGKLYVGTERNINGEGACIYRYNGSTDFDSINQSAWEKVLELSANQSTTISVLEVFNGSLYAGTFQVDFSSTLSGPEAVNLSDGCEIWRSSTGDPGTWEHIVGDGAPVPAGFGNENNTGVLSMEVFKDKLYVGTYNFKDRAELWRTSDGLNWEPVILHGLGDNNFYVWSMLAMDGELFIGTMNPFTGCEIWRSSTGDPGTWEKANVDGMDGEMMFTPPASIFIPGLIADQYGIRNMVEYDGSLIVGTASWADFLDITIKHLLNSSSWPGLSQNVGCEIWKLDGKNLHISREYINCSTLIYINATDMGVGPCVSDKVRIYYRIWYNGEWTPWMHGDINENVTIDLSEYGLTADCKHIIQYYAVDCLGNEEFTHNRTIYVDCTPPQFLILKPQDGWYSDGSVIPSIVLAEDPWVNGCSSGIEEGSQGSAFLIDVFPGFNVVPLNSSNFLYDYESHEYIGNLVIPDPSGLPDGAVLFVAGGSDNVGNGANSMITMIETYFLQWVAEYGDEEATEAFADWLNDIVTNFNVVVIGIDNTPPMVNITEPEDGADVGIGPMMVKVQAFDNLSGINLGDTVHVKLAGIHIGELVYNETSGLWEGLLAIPSSVPSGEQNLTVEISDLAGNTGSDAIRVIVEERPGPLTTGTTVEPDPAAVGNLIYVNATVVSYISEIADAELFVDEIGSYGTGISMNPADGAWDEMVENVTITIDTTGLSEGVHTVYVHGKDADGRWGAFDEEEFTLYVEDTTPPEFDLLAEKTGVISGSVWYNATNFDPSECVDRVEFYIKPFGEQPIQLATVTEGYNGNYIYVLDTTEYPDGGYYVYAVAYDCAGNSYGGIGVADTFKRPTIDNTPPSVTITHPSMGSTVSGIVDITFDISDVNSIEEVYVKIDDTGFTVSGNHYEWDTTTVSDGMHMITVRAVDEAGNEGSTWILVSVDNSDESDPNIHIVYPTNGTAIEVNELNRGYLKVKINAYDDKTSKENLIVKLWIPGGRRDAPTLWYPVEYNESDGYFYANVDIYKYQNGTQITLCASAEDEAGNYQPAPCLNVRILSPVIWDQWMQNGWNKLILPCMSLCDNSVEKVLTSLNGYYDVVFYYDEVNDSWSSYVPGAPHQTLNEMEPGKEYWIHMNGTETRFYIDDAAPYIEITYPENESLINAFAQNISGTAFDVMGIDYVKIMIEDHAPCCTVYWNGSAWQSSPCWLLCDGTDYWQYLDTRSINMSGKSGHRIKITAMAVDNLGCSATDTIVFVYDDQPPVSHIDFISPYVNTAPDITGWTEDDYALDYVEVCLNFTNSPTGTTYYWNFSSGMWQSEEYWEVVDQSGLTDTWDLSASDPENSDYESGVKYYVTAKATDLAGNKESTAIAFFTYDAIQPFDITIEYPVDGETYNCGEPSEINGTAADGETFVDRVYIWIEDSDTSLYWNGSAWTDQPVDLECSYADGIWSYMDVPEWEDNLSYIIHAFAQDAAGNVNDTTAQFNYSCPSSG